MVIPLLFVAGLLGTVEVSPALVYTPTEILAEHATFYEKSMNGQQSPLRVRFRVGSVSSQTVMNVDKQTFKQIVIYPVSGGSKDAEFYIAITPQVEKEFKRLGVSDLQEHFRGKEIEIQGRFDCVYLNIYGSPTFYMYHIDITDLNQIRMVKEVSSKQPDFSFPLPDWRVFTD